MSLAVLPPASYTTNCNNINFGSQQQKIYSPPSSPMRESVDPSFFIYMERISLEKLRREEQRRARAIGTDEAPPTPVLRPLSPPSLKAGGGESKPLIAPNAVLFSKSLPDLTTIEAARYKVAVKGEDIRWRTFVKLSYQKARICARLLKGGTSSPPTSFNLGICESNDDESSPSSPQSVFYNNTQSANSCTTLVDKPTTNTLKEETSTVQQRRGRSRSDAFIIRPGNYRPNVSLFLSLSSPMQLPLSAKKA